MKSEILSCATQLSAITIPVAILMIENDEDRQLAIELYLENHELMYKVAHRYFGSHEADIEDAVGTAIEDMCRYVEKFRSGKCNNRRAYVLSIIGNACRRQISTFNRIDSMKEYAASQDAIENVPDAENVYQSVFDYSDALMLLNSFSGLSESDKDFIRMRHIDGMSYQEIAERVKMSEGAVRVALTRAKQRLQKQAADRGGELL